MARRTRKSRRTRTFFSRFRKRSRSSSNGSRGVSGTELLGAALYGATRNDIANMVTPLSSKVPVGTIGDELVIGGGAWFAKKYVRMPLLKSFLNSAMVVEAARVGAAVRDGSAFATASSSSNATIPIF